MHISHYGDAETGIPKAEITISDCGVMDKHVAPPKKAALMNEFLAEKLVELTENNNGFVIVDANEETQE